MGQMRVGMTTLADFDPQLVKDVLAHADDYDRLGEGIDEIIREAERDLDAQEEKLLERTAAGDEPRAVEVYRQSAERIHKEADAKIRMFLAGIKKIASHGAGADIA